MGDELFIRCYHGAAGDEHPSDPFSRGFEAPEQLDEDVNIGVEDIVKALRPLNAIRYPVHALFSDPSIEDVRQAERRDSGSILDQDPGDRRPHWREAGNRYLEDRSSPACGMLRGWAVRNILRQCDVLPITHLGGLYCCT